LVTSLVNTPYELVRLDDPEIRPWKLRTVRAIDGWTARHLTTHFHAITHAVKGAAVRDLRIDASRVSVIERGRDPQRLGGPSAERRAHAREALGLGDDRFVVLSVGRQEFQKGQWNLLEAIPQASARVPDLVALVAGRRGNASVRLEETARRLSLNGCANLLGHRDDVPDILAAADLFVFPSLYEGLGGALIEAMALGLPIVASDLPAIREVVEDGRNAVLVPAGSPRALSDAITDLAADQLRRHRMAERSRAIFLDRFTLERSSRRMVELFERVASEGPREGL
jgi:glycosyltransferase involved in cell wall biosynthesis